MVKSKEREVEREREIVQWNKTTPVADPDLNCDSPDVSSVFPKDLYRFTKRNLQALLLFSFYFVSIHF